MVVEAHDILVVQPGAGTDDDSQREGEVVVRPQARPAQSRKSKVERRKLKEEYTADGEEDTYPLPGVEAFSEDEHRADEGPHRSCRLPRADDRDREVLEREIGAEPGAEDDHGFEDGQQVAAEIERRHEKSRLSHQRWCETGEQQGDEQDARRDEDTGGQDIDHRAIAQSYLLADIIKP